MDFIQTYGKLTAAQQRQFAQRYPQEEHIMTTWSQRLLMQGREEGHQTGLQTGLQTGRQEGEAAVLLRQLTRRFGPLGAPMTEKIRQATTTELEQWADRILDARTLDDIFQQG